MTRRPGTIVLFGSGETSPEAQRVYDSVMRRIPPPIRVCVLETPAGFEPNSEQVAGRVADFLRVRLQNYHPDVRVIPARRRGSAHSPDDPEVVAPMLEANFLMMGPGSPSYAVRQLGGSRAWNTLIARHRLGNLLVLASAATVAASAFALPVYEIYKVGEDLHWKNGLDLLGPYGPRIAFLPHWNNGDGGDDLDTSRCFMGVARFQQLHAMLPSDAVVVGIDEHTALIVDFERDTCEVIGHGAVTWMRGDVERRYDHGDTFSLLQLGLTRRPEPNQGVPENVWEEALDADSRVNPPHQPDADVLNLVEARARARAIRDWANADRLREEITRRGWQVNDGHDGTQLIPIE